MPRQPPRRKREHVESVGEAQASMEVKEKRRRTSLVVSERPEQSSSVGSSTHANEAPTASNEELPGLSGLSPEELVHSWERNKPASDTLIQSLKQQLKLCQLEEARAAALVWRCSDSKEKTVQLAQAKDPSLHQIDSIRLNVGGEVFVVPINTLLGREPHSLFHVLLSSSEEGDGLAPVLTDESGAIFIDRDPEIFRLILNYLRGYQHLHLLGSELVEKLRIDARYFLLRGLLDNLTDPDPMGSSQGFQCGPGVSPERNRLRVVYCVAMVGETFFVTGKHSITYEVLVPDYIGVGLVSDACTRHDQEFHKVPNCSIYYMSGVFYTNFPYHRKEENLEKIERGDFITISVDMDKGTAEYVLKNSVKTISLNGARRLRFAVTMKSGSAVRIVSQDEVEAMRRRVDEEAGEVPTRPVLFT